MSYPRVNLLKKNEQRYQGIVSQRFLFSVIILAPILVVALVGVIQFSEYGNIKEGLQSSHIVWDGLDPRLAKCRKEKGGVASNQQLIDLLGGWEKSRPSLSTLMDGLQGVVPENIQFRRLTLRCDLGSAVSRDPADLEPSYLLVIEGVSQGTLAENEVIQFRKDLLECTQVSEVFDSIKLASMRQRRGNDAVDQREFRLEGEVLEGGRQ